MIGSFIKSTKDFINITIKFAPLFIGVALLVFGLISANWPYVLLFIGMFLLTPIIVYILYYLTTLVNFTGKFFGKDLGLALWEEGTAYGLLFPTAGDDTPASAPFMWFAMFMFFMSYLFISARGLYNYTMKGSVPEKERARKMRAVIGMVAPIILTGAVLAYRSSRGLIMETELGLVVISGAVIYGAYLWNKMLVGCSSHPVYLDDVYGVKTNIINPSLEKKTVCIAQSTG